MVSTPGIGSGLDINGIITGLMNVEKLGLQKMQSQKTSVTSSVSTYGQINNLLTDFQTQINKIKDFNTRNYYKTDVSDSNRLSASVSAGQASLGTHTIVVNQLASAHQIASNGFSTSSTSLGTTGDLNIQMGSQSFQVTIDNTNNTLEGIKNAINSASNNPGVQASLLKVTNNGTDEYRLLLTATKTGASNAITLSDNSGNVAATLNAVNQISPAQDAQFSVDGYSVIRSSNIIDDVLGGVSFTLKSNDNTPMTLNITEDQTSRNKAFSDLVSGFVDKYNNLVSVLDNQQASQTKGDRTFNLIKQQLRSVIDNSAVSLSQFSTLKSIGISTKASEKLTTSSGVQYVSYGKIELDSTKLNSFLTTNFNDVLKTFNNSTDGYITRMTSKITDLTKFGGTVDLRLKTLNSNQRTLDDRITREQDRLSKVEENLRLQYSRLDTILAQFKNTSDYLTKQLSSNSSSSN